MPANVEHMFSAREIPWHRVGEVTEGALSSKEAIVKAGLDWTVSTRPLATFDRANETEGNFIDCLLYTSPSPRDATLSRMPSSA